MQHLTENSVRQAPCSNNKPNVSQSSGKLEPKNRYFVLADRRRQTPSVAVESALNESAPNKK